MTKEELIKAMEEINNRKSGDFEADHSDMDDLLLKYIDDPKVTELYAVGEKWCA